VREDSVHSSYSAHSMYAVIAFDAGAIEYLMERFDDERLAKTLARAKAALIVGQITDDIKTAPKL
jgi:DNA-binding LytR/AlgR family response regulator